MTDRDELLTRLTDLVSELSEYRDDNAILHLQSGIRNVLDDLVADAVKGARFKGESWQEIAGKLGTTRQAAHERYSRIS